MPATDKLDGWLRGNLDADQHQGEVLNRDFVCCELNYWQQSMCTEYC